VRSETPEVGKKLRGKPPPSAEFEAKPGSPVHLTIDLEKGTISP
jgi:hypothetical protein